MMSREGRERPMDDKLAALEAKIAAEDAAAEADPEVPEDDRTVGTHPDFLSQGAVPRDFPPRATGSDSK